MRKLDILIPVYYLKLNRATRAAIRAAAHDNGVSLTQITAISIILTQSPTSIANGNPPCMMFLHYDNGERLIEVGVKLLRRNFYKFKEKYVSPITSKT